MRSPASLPASIRTIQHCKAELPIVFMPSRPGGSSFSHAKGHVRARSHYRAGQVAGRSFGLNRGEPRQSCAPFAVQ